MFLLLLLQLAYPNVLLVLRIPGGYVILAQSVSLCVFSPINVC